MNKVLLSLTMEKNKISEGTLFFYFIYLFFISVFYYSLNIKEPSISFLVSFKES